jgi:hypothetical protein
MGAIPQSAKAGGYRRSARAADLASGSEQVGVEIPTHEELATSVMCTLSFELDEAVPIDSSSGE